MGNRMEAALYYARQGWSVIPVSVQTKKPMIEWAEFVNRRATEKEIRQWWEDNPNANVAVITGKISNLVVVDVDVKRGGNAEKINEESPCSHVLRTGSGGWHLYYTYPPDAENVGNRVNVRQGIDVRGDGGYVVCAPSIHANGSEYQWLRGDSETRFLPAPLFAVSGAAREDGQTEPDGQWLTRILKGVDSGGRNDACARLAGYYASKHLPPDVVLENLKTWNTRNKPPLPDSEIATTVDSVFKTSSRKAKGLPERPVMEASETFGLTDFSTYMSKYGEQDIPWLIDGWMPDSTIAMQVAPPGTFKTWLELDLAVSVASGLPFLGHFPVLRPGPVIVIQQEDFHGQIAERLAVIVLSRFDLRIPNTPGKFGAVVPPSLPIFIHPDRRLRFSDSVVMAALEQKIKEIRPVLVIIDPLYSTGQTDDYMTGTVQEMFALKNMRDKYGCSFLIAHHTKKAAEGSDRESAWGSQFLNAFIETGWQVRPKDSPGTAVIRRHFKVRANIAEQNLQFNINTLTGPWLYEVTVSSPEDGPDKEVGPGIVEMLMMNGAMTLADIAALLKVHRTTALRKLNKLIAVEVVRRVGEKYVAADDLNAQEA